MSNKYSISITNSTVGATAIGSGAEAEGSVSRGRSAPTGSLFRFKFKARNASKADIARWLRTAAEKVEQGDAATFAHGSVPGPSIAWELEKE